jgi:hypothetical protein
VLAACSNRPFSMSEIIEHVVSDLQGRDLIISCMVLNYTILYLKLKCSSREMIGFNNGFLVQSPSPTCIITRYSSNFQLHVQILADYGTEYVSQDPSSKESFGGSIFCCFGFLLLCIRIRSSRVPCYGHYYNYAQSPFSIEVVVVWWCMYCKWRWCMVVGYNCKCGLAMKMGLEMMRVTF